MEILYRSLSKGSYCENTSPKLLIMYSACNLDSVYLASLLDNSKIPHVRVMSLMRHGDLQEPICKQDD